MASVNAKRLGGPPLVAHAATAAELDEEVAVIMGDGDRLDAGGVEIESADLTQRPRARVPVDESDAAKLMRLIDALEENDDVSAVHANFDVDSAVLERVAQ